MKTTNILAAFLGGAIVGAAFALLFAPENGKETRRKLKEALAKRGIHFTDDELSNFTEEIKEEIKSDSTNTK